MRLVDKLICRELIAPLFNSIFMFLMLLFASAYLFKLTDLITQGVSFATVLRIGLYSLPTLVTQTLPMSMLLASLLGFGRLSGDSEHIALFASGISFIRIAMPVAFLGLLVSLITIAWNETVVPPATRAYYDLLQHATEHIKATDKPLNYVILRGDGHVDEFVDVDGGYDAKTRSLRRVNILKMSDDPRYQGQPELNLYADHAIAKDPKGLDWDYYDVTVTWLRPESNKNLYVYSHMNHATTSTLPKNVRLGKDFRGIMETGVTDNHRLTFAQLRRKINVERAEGSVDTRGDEVDLWEKISLPLASLIFGLVGAALGVRPHRGSKAMGFGIAISIIFVYWVVYHWMYILGKTGSLPPALASFMADILGMIAAGVLIAKARQ
jgi:lipopolysaccharide export system permease protein